jgi:hypothetical protein
MPLNLCILSAGKLTALAVSAFTLSWTHSVEKVRWQESWQVTGEGLRVVEARVQGSGAGMDPPEGSRFVDGWWVYRPQVPPQRSVLLASSGATVGGWRLCSEAGCRELGEEAGAPVELSACDAGSEPRG